MKAILLAGGLGTRLREETEFRPKPMVEVGGRPILWHIMKHLSGYGIREFIVATGYKSNVVKEYFLNYKSRNSDFTIELGDAESVKFHDLHDEGHWSVTVAYTGDLTMTGGRVSRVARYLEAEAFLVTYGDGLADVNIDALLEAHRTGSRLATVTTVRPPSRFGVMEVDESGQVTKFREKPVLDEWVNIGFFIFEPAVLQYLDYESVLEEEPLANLAADGELTAYRHDGFWQPMDTYREVQLLNKLWESGRAPWRTWE